MLKLKNISMNGSCISALYFPEDSTVDGRVVLHTDSNLSEYTLAAGYGKEYAAMALRCLRGIAERKKNQPEYRIPEEKLVMWY